MNGTDFDNGYYLGVFGGFGAAQAVLSFSRNFFMYMACASAAASIHKSLLNIVMKAKTRFFDITPTGSVINRFSGDMNVVDRELPQVCLAIINLN